MSVKVSISKVLLPDNLPPDGDDYGPGPFVGVIARATIAFPYGAESIVAILDSPGVWSVDEPSAAAEYGDEIFDDERAILVDMLGALRDWKGQYETGEG